MIITPHILLVIGLLFALKHWVIDSLLQAPYQYLNKGNLSHPGGYLHAGLHGLATLFILAPYGFAALGFLDAFIHFWVDWAKVNLTKKYGWSQMTDKGLLITSENYFHALIGDQCLHFATYILLIFLMGWI